MKTTLRILPILLGAMLFFTQCEKDNYVAEELLPVGIKKSVVAGDAGTQELWAGAGQNDLSKGTLVGEVKTTVLDGNLLKVEYFTFSHWKLTEAHLWVGNEIKKIPRNAAPGQFPFKENLGFADYVEFTIDLEKLGIANGGPIYVAAHGVVEEPDGVEGLEAILPETLTFSVKMSESPFESYFETTVKGGPLAGSYKGWCIDPTIPIPLFRDHDATVHSSYADLPDLFSINIPENLDRLNWLINQDFVGKASSCGGNFTYGDIQVAIWKLIVSDKDEDEDWFRNTPGLKEFDRTLCRANELHSLALSEGAGFKPGCGQRMAVILFKKGIQLTIIEVRVPCGGDETAWALGGFPFMDYGIARKWGWIFKVGDEF